MFGVRAFILFPIVENVSQITNSSLMELTTEFRKSSKKKESLSFTENDPYRWRANICAWMHFTNILVIPWSYLTT